MGVLKREGRAEQERQGYWRGWGEDKKMDRGAGEEEKQEGWAQAGWGQWNKGGWGLWGG